MKDSTCRQLVLRSFLLITALLFASAAMAQAPYVTTWKTDNPGISNSTSITLPVIAGRTGYNFDVDWDSDGVYDETGVTGPISHDYGTPGTYTVSIRGDFPAMQFANRDEDVGPDHDDALKLIEVNQWGDIVWYDMSYALYGCENMQLLATDAPDLTNVSSLNSLFRRCKVMNADVNHWDVSNVRDFFSVFNTCHAFNQPLDKWDMSNATTISYMFFFCKAFNQPLNDWNVSGVSNFIEAFVGCENFNQPLDKWNTGSATSMARMFRLATVFDQDISAWNVSRVRSFSGMFSQAYSFNQNLNAWQVGTATDFGNMFEATSLFNQPLDEWDMSNATNTSYMFSQSAFNQDISGWNVSRVTNMAAMFYNNRVFNQPIGSWDVSRATNMSMMFRGAEAFEQDISGWNTANVTDMSAMFLGAAKFNIDISGWNTGQVEDFESMFNLAAIFNQDIGNWNTSSATDMHNMFSRAPAFNQDLKNWDVSKVTDMSTMFYHATSFDHDLADWDISSVTDMEDMLDRCAMSGYNYDRTLIGWAASDTKNAVVPVGAEGLLYCSGASARSSLINNNGWVFTGDTNDCSYTPTAFITTWKTDNPGSSNSTSITIPTAEGITYNYDVDWDNDGVYDEFGLTGDVTHDFGAAGTYTIRINGDFPRIFFDYYKANDDQKLLDVVQWGDIAWTSMKKAFDGCSNLNFSATDAPDLSRVTSMGGMFWNCTSFNSDINHWDVSTVTEFNDLFHTASAFNQPLDKWDVSSGTTFSNMFIEAGSFNQDISGWNVSEVTTMYRMFWSATSFNQNINAWNVGKVTSMEGMFSGATSFNQDLNDWNVSSVKNMRQLFNGATSFNGNITGWNVSNVQNMGYTFANTPFNQDIGNWNTESVTTMLLMFNQASSFNQDIGRWNVSKVKSMEGMFQNAISFNQYIGDWNTTSLVSTNNMFKGATAFDRDIGNWDMEDVTEIHGMFWGASSFNQDVGRWNVSNVEDMAYVFFNARKFNQDISDWNTGSATVMQNMFNGATLFNQNISDWDVSQVTNMSAMFSGSTIDQNFGRWDVSKVTGMVRMFSGVTLSTENYDSLLIGWNKLDLQPGVEFGGGNSQYCAGAAARAEMIAGDGWVIDDGGPEGTAPVAVCRDLTLYMQQDGTVSFTVADLDGGSTDNCSNITLTAARTAFDCSEVNTTLTEVLTVSDVPGNTSTCNASITLLPSLEFTCPEDIILTAPGGSCTASAVWETPLVACGAILTSDHASGDDFSTGTTTVTYTAKDGMGNINTCSFKVTVIATPEITGCPADMTVSSNAANCGATVSWTEPTVACGIDLSSSHKPGDLFASGNTEVTYTATASDGATATCSFTVNVSSTLAVAVTDIKEPSCPGEKNGAISVEASGGNAPYRYAWFNANNSWLDNKAALSQVAAGTYRVDVIDASGCRISETFQVQDTAPLTVGYTMHNDTEEGAKVVPEVTGGTAPYTYLWSGSLLKTEITSAELPVSALGTYYLQVSDALGCSAEMSVDVSLEDIRCETLEYSLYPNPTDGLVHLNFGPCAQQVSIQVFDVLGKKVREIESADFTTVINLQEFTDGTYSLKISDGRNTKYERITLRK